MTMALCLVRQLRRVTVLAVMCWLTVSAPDAAEPPTHITGHATQLDTVLSSAQCFSPQILQAQMRLQERQADIVAAQGQFDPFINSELGGRLSGFYDGKYVNTEIIQPLQQWGARIFAGYRVSDGTFPIYEDERHTLTLGEFRVGFALSLLRDRAIDAQRYQLRNAKLEHQAEQMRWQSQQLKVQQQAYLAYARWLLSARLQRAFTDLHQLAIRRDEALQRSVNSGELPQLVLMENRQVLLQRESLLLDAQRQYQLAAQQLSLYLRDQHGNPQLPHYQHALSLPQPNIARLATDHPTPVEQALIEKALALRPDIRIAELAREQAGLQKSLADNLRAPRLDLSAYSARDIGNGSTTLTGTDNVVQLKLDIPLRTRQAQGRAAAAQAKADALQYQIQWLRDQAITDIRSAFINVTTTRRLNEIASEALTTAEILAQKEERRFESGLSDFFLLNVRERSLSEAQLEYLQTQLNHHIALITYFGVTMNLEALGLTGGTVTCHPPYVTEKPWTNR